MQVLGCDHISKYRLGWEQLTDAIRSVGTMNHDMTRTLSVESEGQVFDSYMRTRENVFSD